MLPLITKFNSNSVLYDALGSISNSYVSMSYNKNYIYFLMDTSGTVQRYDTTSEEVSSVYVNKSSVNYSAMEYKDGVYGFEGYNPKRFVDETVIYIQDNNKLVQESYDRQAKVTLLQSSTEIRDFFIDDSMNYYVLHNKNQISKFSKDRILKYSINITPSLSSVFNGLGVMPNDEIQLLSIDYVREYTDTGLNSYPIILGTIKNGTSVLSSGQMFLGKIDETVINTALSTNSILSSYALSAVSYANFLPLTGQYYPYGDPRKINYNLTNYDYLKNQYPVKDELVFKVVLQNVYNNKEKIRLEIPISTYLFQSESHHFAFRLNGIEGHVTVFCDGKEVGRQNFARGQYIFQDIFRESVTVGNTYFYNNETLSKYLNQPNYYFIDNSSMKQFKIYKKALSDNEIDFHVYRGINMQDLVVSLPCDQRNELDGIERQFKLDTTGNKSNKINIIIKNSQLTNSIVQNHMKDIIFEKLKKILPITTTINNIEFR